MPRLSLAAFVLVFGLLQSLPLAAEYKTVPPEETEKAEKEMCEKVGCAFDVHIVLKRKDGSTYDKSFHSVPVAQPGGISVYAGQSVLFEADIQGDELANFKLVKTVEHPEKTLSASLEQESDNSMMLILRNPFKKNLKIAMGIMPLDHDGLLKTSSCAVLSGRTGFELWPYPIFQVWLGNMRLLDDSSQMTCSE
jgi:hypothetical protein